MAILTTEGTKFCWMCRETKPRREFWANKSRGDGLAHECKPCSRERVKAWKARHPERNRELMRSAMHRHRHGSDAVEWTAKQLERQGGLCAICREDFGERGPFVDHDHSCCPGKRACGKCRRGLLCQSCNTAIGLLKDDPMRLASAIRYLGGQ